MQSIILGDGAMGRAIAEALRTRGDATRVLGRPGPGGHDPAQLAEADVLFEASRGDAVATNLETALEAGVRRFVVATTGWDGDREAVDRRLRRDGAAALVAPNLSLGAAVFLRLVEAATELLGPIDAFDPYVTEWHRRTKRDRPSGTAGEIARRILARHPRKTRIVAPGADGAYGAPEEDELEIAVVRAGTSPGMHLVGFDAPGETIELRITARDRSAYAAGALVTADWLMRAPRAPGIHSMEEVVDELATGISPTTDLIAVPA